MSKLSPRQQAILNYIKKEVEEKGYPPSVREIGEAVGLASSSTVHGHLSRLEKKGFIRRDPTKPRALDEAYAVSGLTKNYFRELFQAAMGCSPSEHLQRLRLRRAQTHRGLCRTAGLPLSVHRCETTGLSMRQTLRPPTV